MRTKVGRYIAVGNMQIGLKTAAHTSATQIGLRTAANTAATTDRFELQPY